jgi:hypothetical protein
MKRALIAVLATMVLTGTVPAADKPNFSGEWKMNAAKSDFGQLPPPTSFVRRIEHSDPLLTIVEDQSAGGAKSTTTRKLTTDGKSSALELNGMAAACSAAWDGTVLTAATTLDSVGLKFTDKMSLSADRKLLTSKIKIASPQGDADLTVVFERQ